MGKGCLCWLHTTPRGSPRPPSPFSFPVVQVISSIWLMAAHLRPVALSFSPRLPPTVQPSVPCAPAPTLGPLISVLAPSALHLLCSAHPSALPCSSLPFLLPAGSPPTHWYSPPSGSSPTPVASPTCSSPHLCLLLQPLPVSLHPCPTSSTSLHVPTCLPITTQPPVPHLVPPVYAQLGSRLVPTLSSPPVAPHACSQILEGTEEQVSVPHTPALSSPAPSTPRPSLGPLMWLSFCLLLPRVSCMRSSYSENSSPLLRTLTSDPWNPHQGPDPLSSSLSPRRGTPAPPLGDPEPISPPAPGLPRLGVEGDRLGDTGRAKVKENFGGGN